MLSPLHSLLKLIIICLLEITGATGQTIAKPYITSPNKKLLIYNK